MCQNQLDPQTQLILNLIFISSKCILECPIKLKKLLIIFLSSTFEILAKYFAIQKSIENILFLSRGCLLQNCQYLSNLEGEYENVASPDGTPNNQHQHTALQRRYERSFSPPRSSNSSGYGTGSSSRSFNDPRFPVEGTMNSGSSGHSAADDRWWVTSDRLSLNDHYLA